MGLERMGTHSESCYKWHLECAVSRYEALRARVAEGEHLLRKMCEAADHMPDDVAEYLHHEGN